MFKNMKKLIAVALPVLTLSLTSCDRGAKLLSYEKVREFAENTYDSHALDTVPMVYTGNFNKMEANVNVSYVTPEGNKDSFNVSFGFNGIHVTINDRYAICLSSTLVDSIEKYYSDFVGFAISLQETSPIDMNYILIDNSSTRVAFTTSEKMIGSLLVKLLQLASGAADAASSAAGFLPRLRSLNNPSATTQVGALVQQAIIAITNMIYSSSQSGGGGKVPGGGEKPDNKPLKFANFLISYLNYFAVSVFDSSKAHGEVFHTYLTADKYGFLRDLDFFFKSSFTLNGIAALKEYTSGEPQEGEQPKDIGAPYRFTLSGSFDFDFNIHADYAK